MKKKFGITSKDKEDWKSFTQNLRNINPKEVDVVKQVLNIKIAGKNLAVLLIETSP